jgi:hypothetical protein
MSAAELVPLVVLGLGVLVVVWIYSDAKQHAEVGNPVVGRLGNFTVATPAAWAAGCLVLSVIFIPLYIMTRV